MTTVLGIDPGTHLGICQYRSFGKNTHSSHRTAEIDLSDLKSIIRLGVLYDTLESYFEVGLDLVTIEGYAFMRGGVGSFTLAEYGGVIRLMALAWGVPILVVNPMHVKMFATGKASKVGKVEIALAVQRMWQVSTKTDNEADAVVLAHIGMEVCNGKKLSEVSREYQLRVIEKYATKIESSHVRYRGKLRDRFGR